MRARSRTTYGRDSELTQLLAVAAEVRAAEAASVLVCGAAGVGKSRLVGELVARLQAEGGLVIVGHGVHLAEGELPFGVLAESLRDLVRTVDADHVRELLGVDTEALAPLVPALRTGPRPQADRARIISATTDLVEALAAERFVCWLVEDLQWTDASTRDAFTYVARSLRQSAVLTLATWRDEGVEDAPVLGARTEVVDLTPLSARDMGSLVREVAPGLAAGERNRVVELSQGLPFLAEELVSSWRGGVGVDPDYLRRLVLTRLPDLSVSARELIELAAVGEGHLDVGLLEDRLDVTPAAIREAVAAGILDTDRSDGSLRFRHALLREAVQDATPAGDRRRLHRRWAEAIVEDEHALPPYARTAALAQHWYGAAEPVRALPALVAAAREASLLPAPTAELTAWSRVVELWDDVDDAAALTGVTKADALVHATRGALAGGDPAPVEMFLRDESTRTTPGADLVGDAWLELRLSLLDGGFLRRDPDRDLAIARILLAAGEDPRVVDGLFILVANGFLLGHETEVEAVVLRMAHQATDPRQVAWATMVFSSLCTLTGEFDRGLSVLREQQPRIVAAPLADQWIYAVHVAWDLILLGRTAEGLAVVERELARLSRPTALSGGYRSLSENQAHALVSLGRWDEALEVTSTALRQLPELEPAYKANRGIDWLRMHACDVLSARGEHEQAQELATQVREHLGEQRWTEPVPETETLAQIASVWAASRDLDRCRAELAGAWELPYSPALSEQLPRAVLVALRAESTLVDRHDAAAVAASLEVVDTVLSAAHPLLRPGPRGRAWWAEAQAHAARARGVDAPTDWAAAVDGWRECGHVYDVAMCLRWLGEAQLAAGETTAAAASLAEAGEICGRLGASPLLEDVQAVARRGRVGDDVAPGPGPLTARETEVLALVAEGRSNQQVAEDLFMSPKTVSVHVSRILAKLGAANRTEAAATGRRLGLLD